jgi:uncharacterized protein (DUF983 family)
MAEARDNAELFLRALSCRCPRCGIQSVYAGFLRFKEKCENCGLAIGKHDNGDGPAVFLIFILGFALVPIAIFIGMNTDWPLWLHGLIWSVVITGATVGLLRPAKALTLAIQYKHRGGVFE